MIPFRYGHLAALPKRLLCGLGLVVLITAAQPALAQQRFSDAALADGFFRTVFGLEHDADGRGASLVKKYSGPVRLFIDQRAQIDRSRAIERFVALVGQTVRGLDLELVRDREAANFTVFVVDRAQYEDVIQNDVYSSQSVQVRGRCMVRVLTTSSGISQSQAVIVSDEGEFLFNRCMVEEILQGLGPLNDDPSLSASVFNDTTDHARFMLHDRYVLNMLYHPLILPGMSREEVAQVMDSVLSDVRSSVP